MIADEILIAALAIYLGGEPVCITGNLAPTAARNDNGKADEDIAAGVLLEETRRGQVGPVAVGLKSPVRAMSQCMDDAFRLSFTIEVEDFLPSNRVFQ